jgi:hypothetical protein
MLLLNILFTGTVTRFCNNNDGPVWGDVSLSNCRTSDVINLVDKVITILIVISRIIVD